MAGMLPNEMPVINRPPVVLRAFRHEDVGLVQSVAGDPLIPLITTVPASGDASDARAYIERQHERLTSGVGYSFAIADAVTCEAVGQAGLWLRNLDAGRASTGYWIASQFRRRHYATAALDAISRWGLSVWQFSTCPVIPACCRATPAVPFFSSAVSSSTTIASGSPSCATMNRCSGPAPP